MTHVASEPTALSGADRSGATPSASGSASDANVASRSRVWRAVLRAARPRQWTKNALVLVAPATAGVLDDPFALGPVIATFALFCLAASGTYLLNDALDAPADRLHPVKRRRPVARGLVSVRTALTVAGAGLVGAVALSLVLVPAAVTITVGLYVLLTVSYSLGLKRVPYLDALIVAVGFALRAVAGGLAVDVPLSNWFLVVTSCAALFAVTGKRYAELRTLVVGPQDAHRAALTHYTPRACRQMLVATGGVTVGAYTLWALGDTPSRIAVIASIFPLAAALWRYTVVALAGGAGDPVEVLFTDRGLQAAVVTTGTLLALGLYVT